ncbi:MAG: transporter substrate-binding protein, partial [Ilumatobacteraceae bacterium]|nr:transporter substrate-binding protein [Ilumatobacteraceae bacterium]
MKTRHITRVRRSLIAGVLMAGLALAACGSDTSSTTTQAATTTGAASTSAGGAEPTNAVPTTSATSATPGTGASSSTSGSGSAATTSGGTGTATTVAAGPTPQGDKVTIGIGSEPETLDVDKSRAGTNNYVLTNIFEQLTTHGPDGKLQPSLAKSWTMSSDGLTYDFLLRDGATFQDGSPVTADDVVFSFQRFIDPNLGNVFAYQLAGMDHIEAVSPTEVKIVLKAPDGAFLNSGGYASIVPKAYITKIGDDAFATNPIGTGPWAFASRAIGTSLSLKRYDGYWGAKPGYANLEFRIIPDDNSRVAALRSGELDAAAQIPPQSVETLKADSNLNVVTTTTGDNIFLIFNSKQTDKPWGDPRVRQALSMAIDQGAIHDSVLGGLATLMSGVAPLDDGWDPAAVDQPKYDPDGAKALLKEAGFDKGFTIELWGPVNGRLPNSEQFIQAVAGFWEDIGVTVDVKLVAYSQYVDAERATSTINGVVMGLYGDSITFDPQARLQGTMTCAGPYSHVCDPKLDDMITKVATTPDHDARVQTYKDAFD